MGGAGEWGSVGLGDFGGGRFFAVLQENARGGGGVYTNVLHRGAPS